ASAARPPGCIRPSPGVEGKPAELVAEPRQPSAIIERAKLLEYAVAFVDRALLWWIEEREALDIAETERLPPQAHTGEADPLDLRIGVRGSPGVVVLLVQPEAHAA